MTIRRRPADAKQTREVKKLLRHTHEAVRDAAPVRRTLDTIRGDMGKEAEGKSDEQLLRELYSGYKQSKQLTQPPGSPPGKSNVKKP